MKENTKSIDSLRNEIKSQQEEYLKVIKKLSSSLEIKELEIKRLKEDNKVEEKNSSDN